LYIFTANNQFAGLQKKSCKHGHAAADVSLRGYALQLQ